MDPHLEPHWATSALITIDVQRDFLSDGPFAIPGTSEVLSALSELVAAFRAAGRPIVHIVRLYPPVGGDADRVRRTLIESGAEFVRPGSPGRLIAPELLPPRAVLATDATSQSSQQGFREIAGIGTVLMSTPAITDAVQRGG